MSLFSEISGHDASAASGMEFVITIVGGWRLFSDVAGCSRVDLSESLKLLLTRVLGLDLGVRSSYDYF